MPWTQKSIEVTRSAGVPPDQCRKGIPLIMRTQGAALDHVGTQALAPAINCTGRRPDAAVGWARACEGGNSAQRKGCCC